MAFEDLSIHSCLVHVKGNQRFCIAVCLTTSMLFMLVLGPSILSPSTQERLSKTAFTVCIFKILFQWYVVMHSRSCLLTHVTGR